MNTVNLINLIPDRYEVREAFKTFRTNVLFCGADIKTIAITSSIQSEGKSLVSLELAKSLSDMGKKVLLIDTDLRRSTFASKHASETGMLGLSHYLAGHANEDEVVYQTQFDSLFIVFSGPFPPNPVELLAGKRFSDLLEYYRGIFDYIIIDTPPIGLVIDAAVIATKCDGVILNIASNRVDSKTVNGAVDQLERSGCHILGTVLNMTDVSGGTYYKKYYKRYYGKYGEYSGRSGSQSNRFVNLERKE